MASRKAEKDARKQARLDAEQAAAAEQRRRKLFTGIGAAASTAVIVVVALILISQSSGEDEGGGEVAGVETVDSLLAGVPQRGTVLGERSQEVRIVEFGDLQCPACAELSETVIPELIEGPVAAGDAQLEFRNFTILGPDSELAARAALAASEQGRYWQFVELFYANQGAEGSGYVSDGFLTGVAEGAGVPDLDAWNESRADPRWDDVLAKTQEEAAGLGLTGTPSIVVQGPAGTEVLGGFPSTEQIERALTAARG